MLEFLSFEGPDNARVSISQRATMVLVLQSLDGLDAACVSIKTPPMMLVFHLTTNWL